MQNVLMLLLVLSDHKGIIGNLDWKEISTFPKDSMEYINSKSVGDVYDSSGFRCNGTHIGNNSVVTAGHCCSPSNNRFRNGTCLLVSRDTRKDICILKCELPENFPQVKIGTEITEDMYILHRQCPYHTNPGCALSMKYSPGIVDKVEDGLVYYSADTLGGSSGAGVFNANHELVGIHTTYSPNQKLNYGRLLRE